MNRSRKKRVEQAESDVLNESDETGAEEAVAAAGDDEQLPTARASPMLVEMSELQALQIVARERATLVKQSTVAHRKSFKAKGKAMKAFVEFAEKAGSGDRPSRKSCPIKRGMDILRKQIAYEQAKTQLAEAEAAYWKAKWKHSDVTVLLREAKIRELCPRKRARGI